MVYEARTMMREKCTEKSRIISGEKDKVKKRDSTAGKQPTGI